MRNPFSSGVQWVGAGKAESDDPFVERRAGKREKVEKVP
jgi:hypothetical protein